MSNGVGESSSASAEAPPVTHDPYHIHEDDYVMFRLPNGEVRSHQGKKNGYAATCMRRNGRAHIRNSTLSMGRLGQFSVNNLIGQPYGLTHEIVGKDLNVLPPRSIEDIGMSHALCICVPQ